jgi:L-rhamnonate dehydratase
MRTLRITSVEVHVVRGPAPEPPPGEKQRQVNMIAVYAEHRPPERGPAPVRAGVTESRYLRIGTDLGAEGFYGPIDPETGWSIVHMLTDLLIGQDALAITIAWDKMERSNRHARHGHLKMAISAVDNALWDLRGRVYDAPVWQLLGGASRERIPAYASMLGTSLVPEVAKATAAEGYAGQKWFLADGPGDGPEGMRRNVHLAEQLRDVLGPDYAIMYDVFQGWDLNYALEWARRVASTRPAWLEEPFPPNRYPAFVQLHRDGGIPISTGEHLSTTAPTSCRT